MATIKKTTKPKKTTSVRAVKVKANKEKAKSKPASGRKAPKQKTIALEMTEAAESVKTNEKNNSDSTNSGQAKSLDRELGAERLSVSEKYFEAVGRRKESIARVRLYTKKATDPTNEEKALVIVNGKDYRDYFSDADLWGVVESPLKKLKSMNRFKVTVVVHGGGKSGQAGAIKHGISRTLIDFDTNFRKKLKKSGFLTRDSRAKERRKYGLKKARKAPRWAKR
jgi:small subunit ribosomal protein S9